DDFHWGVRASIAPPRISRCRFSLIFTCRSRRFSRDPGRSLLTSQITERMAWRPICAEGWLEDAVGFRQRPVHTVAGAFDALLQRILFDADEVGGVILGGRVGPPPLGKRRLLHARSQHQRREAVVPLEAARLVED